MAPHRYRQLIDELTPPLASVVGTPQSTPRQDGHAEATTVQVSTIPSPADDPDKRLQPIPEGDTTGGTRPVPAAAEATPLPSPEALVITDAERALLGRLGNIMSTPRAAKRLVNIYRMLRVSVPVDESDAYSPTGGREYQAVIVLLGILVGRPMLAERVLTAIVRADDDDVWEILGRIADVGDRLAPLRPHVVLDRAAPYRRWAPRVSRFSFRLAAVLPIDDALADGAGARAVPPAP